MFPSLRGPRLRRNRSPEDTLHVCRSTYGVEKEMSSLLPSITRFLSTLLQSIEHHIENVKRR